MLRLLHYFVHIRHKFGPIKRYIIHFLLNLRTFLTSPRTEIPNIQGCKKFVSIYSKLKGFKMVSLRVYVDNKIPSMRSFELFHTFHTAQSKQLIQLGEFRWIATEELSVEFLLLFQTQSQESENQTGKHSNRMPTIRLATVCASCLWVGWMAGGPSTVRSK